MWLAQVFFSDTPGPGPYPGSPYPKAAAVLSISWSQKEFMRCAAEAGKYLPRILPHLQAHRALAANLFADCGPCANLQMESKEYGAGEGERGGSHSTGKTTPLPLTRAF